MYTPLDIIDTHQHFWKYNPVRDKWITDDMAVLRRDFLPEHLAPLLEKNNVKGCVAVQADQSLTETDFLLTLAQENDFIKGVVGWIDLRADDLDDQLKSYESFEKLKGFRHIVQGEKYGFLSDENFIRGVARLADFDYAYDLLVYHYQLPEVLAFLPEVHHVRIVIDHMAKPSIKTGEKTHWELDMAAVATFSNVHCKLSGLVTEADPEYWDHDTFFPYLDEVFEMFGPSRVMYGSDWPVCLLAAEYNKQLDIILDYIERLSSREQKMVMSENAIRFYNL
ncbi:amidohydrolase family protein [Pseudochryseolinea flava]|uniref:Amidohydrolase n=1 Tax=Pseudochryseolinea flava TaxID=2059302 RepID=A0A364Y001_9BACT|nr:amidohydrolase family protein [Pseudochryseolinea flava]RAV99206.1 amidohydrolase [Pseudochryseolinea flava]